MGVVLTSTTETQQNLEHGVSEDYRDPSLIEKYGSNPNGKAEKTEEAANEIQPDPQTDTESDKGKTGESGEIPRPKPKKTSAKEQERIDQITKEKYEAKREAQSEREKREAAEKRLSEYEQSKNPQAPLAPDEPQWDNRPETYRPFLAQHHAWTNRQVRIQEQAKERENLQKTYIENTSKVQYADFEEAAANASKIEVAPEAAPHVLEAIFSAKNGPDITYYLGTHKEAAEALSDMTVAQAVAFIRDISHDLASEEKAPPPPRPRVQPPVPLSPVGGSSTRSTVQLDQLPPREFNRIRNKAEWERKHGR